MVVDLRALCEDVQNVSLCEFHCLLVEVEGWWVMEENGKKEWRPKKFAPKASSNYCFSPFLVLPGYSGRIPT
eukprot:2030861-Rhodomonas_salina.1